MAFFDASLALAASKTLADDRPGDIQIFIKIVAKFFVDKRLNNPLDVRITQLGFGLPLELGILDANGNHGGQTLTHIVSGKSFLEILDQIVDLGKIVDRARNSRFETGEMGPTLNGIDIVHKGKNIVIEGTAILKSYFDFDVFFFWAK